MNSPKFYIFGFVLLATLLITTGLFFKNKLFNTTPASPTPSPSPQVYAYPQLVRENKIKPVGQILELNFSYDMQKTPILALESMVKKNGYISPAALSSNPYSVVILNKNNQKLYTAFFIIPNHLSDPPPLPNEIASESAKQLTAVKFTVTLPSDPTAANLEVYDPSHNRILIQSLEVNIPVIDNRPSFQSLPGSEYSLKKQSFLERWPDLLIHPAYAQGDGFLDLAIISEGYTDMTQFHNDVNEIMTTALSYEPFKTRASQILVHFVDNTAGLGCINSQQTARILYCDDQLVTQQLNNAAVPYDVAYVLVNTPDYSGSGGMIAVGYNGPYKGEMLVHELLGHAFGGLLDEYSVYGSNSIDNSTHGLYGSDGNCFAGTPPNPSWNSLVNINDYQLECTFTNWYRSSDSSVMRSLTTKSFNLVSQQVLNRRLDDTAGVFNPSPSPVLSPSPSLISTISPTPQLLPSPSPKKIGDINSDGQVNVFDFNLLVRAFGQQGQNLPTDLNNDGRVDVFDFNLLVREFGT